MNRYSAIAYLLLAIAGCSDLDVKDQPAACATPTPAPSSSATAVLPAMSTHAKVTAKVVRELPEVVAPEPLTLEPLPRDLDPEIACARPLVPARRLPSGASPLHKGLFEECRAAIASAKEKPAAPAVDNDTNRAGLGACTALGRLLGSGHGGPENALLATNLAARACSLGRMDACKVLGDASLSGYGAPFDPDCGEAVVHYACQKGFGDACTQIGELEAVGDLIHHDPADAVKMFERACEAKSYAGCLALAKADKSDPQKAAALSERALMLAESSCDAGGANACRDLAWLYKERTTGGAFPKDFKALHVDPGKAIAFATKACRVDPTSGCDAGAGTMALLEETCKKGDFERCIDLPFERINAGGKGGEFTPQETKAIEDACIGGSSRGCWALGRKYSPTVYDRACADGELSACRPDLHDGPPIAPSPEQRKKACEQGSAIDCRELADSAKKAGSITDAMKLYERACPSIRSRRDYRDIDAHACAEAGRRYRKGDGVTRDPARAVELLLTGCYAEGRLNERGEGCVDLAEMFDQGDGVPVDRDRATDLWAGLCTAQRKACDEVKARLGGEKHE